MQKTDSRASMMTQTEEVIRTERLELRACTRDTAAASLESRHELERLLGRTVPPTWPPDELRDALVLHLGELKRDVSHVGWGVWLALLGTDGPLVGSAGFKGKPDHTGTVEIGYGIEPSFRSRGLAREAVRALLEAAWPRGARRVVAECHPDNLASIRVLESVAMQRLEPRGRMLWWELTVPS